MTLRKLLYMGAGVLALVSVANNAVAQSMDLSIDAPSNPAAVRQSAPTGPGRVVMMERIPLNPDGSPRDPSMRPVPIGDLRDVNERTMAVSESWYSRYYPGASEEFEDAWTLSTGVCSSARHNYAVADQLWQSFTALIPQVEALYGEVMNLGPAQNNAAWWRRALGVLATVIAYIGSGGTYGAIVGAGALSNEATGRAHDRAMGVNQRITLLNLQVMLLNIQSNLLTLDLDRVHISLTFNYCQTYRVGETS